MSTRKGSQVFYSPRAFLFLPGGLLLIFKYYILHFSFIYINVDKVNVKVNAYAPETNLANGIKHFKQRFAGATSDISRQAHTVFVGKVSTVWLATDRLLCVVRSASATRCYIHGLAYNVSHLLKHIHELGTNVVKTTATLASEFLSFKVFSYHP